MGLFISTLRNLVATCATISIVAGVSAHARLPPGIMRMPDPGNIPHIALPIYTKLTIAIFFPMFARLFPVFFLS